MGTDPLAERYARRIRGARAWLGLTQEEFGKLAGGATKKTVRDWEYARATPRSAARFMLAQIFEQVDAEMTEAKEVVG